MITVIIRVCGEKVKGKDAWGESGDSNSACYSGEVRAGEGDIIMWLGHLSLMYIIIQVRN